MQVRGRWYYMQQMIPQIIGAANHDVTHVCGTTDITCNRSWRHTCVCGTTMSCATSPIDVTHVCVVPQKLCATNQDVTHVCVVPQILCATNHDVTHARQIMTSGMWMLPLMMSCAAIIIIIRTVLVLLSFSSPGIKRESFPWEIWILFALQKIGIQLQSN